MDGSSYDHADLEEFQKQLSDVVVTYQQLREGEQSAAVHLLQASLGPLLAVPAEYALTEPSSDGNHLAVADQQQVPGASRQQAPTTQHQHQQHVAVGQRQAMTNQGEKEVSEDRSPMLDDSDHLKAEYHHMEDGEDHLASDSLDNSDAAMVDCAVYPAVPAPPPAAPEAPEVPTADHPADRDAQWGHTVPSTAPSTAENQCDVPATVPAAAPAEALPAKKSRRPGAERYICPVPSCGRPCGHRKALVLHVKWEHLPAPVCCRACRHELNTHAHFLYHNRTCFQGVSALVCPDCGARFTMELPYKRHLAGHALNACHKCDERLSSRKALVKHLRHQHKIRECEKWFACDKCPKRFMKKRSWLTHTKVHATKDDVQCGRCGLTLSKLRLAEHVQAEHAHEPFTCSTCHKRFRRNQQYLQHMRLHEQYDCSLCGKPFVTQADYAGHMQAAHQQQPPAGLFGEPPPPPRYRCEVCGATFWTHAQLNEHLDKHPDASLECSRCQTELESAAQLHRHLRRSLCSRSPQLICHHCGAQFCAHFALRKHLSRVHGEGGPAGRCPHCDYTNSSAANLRRHIAAHQQVSRRYVCDQCAAAFHTLSTLKDHQLYVHTTEKRFVCAECQKAFKTSSSLNRHLRVHSETRPYECCYCDNSYKRMSHLRRHMTAVHNVRTRTRLIARLDGAAVSSDSGSDAAGSSGGGGSGSTGAGGGGAAPAAVAAADEVADEPAEWAAGLEGDQAVTYIDESTLLRLCSVGEGEELSEFTLPQGVYSTDTVVLPDGSRSIVLKPAGELGGPVEGGGPPAAQQQPASGSLPPPSTIRSSQHMMV